MNSETREQETRWCILRCSNCKTLELAKSLTEDGYEAWTPVEVVTRGEKKEQLRLALTPSFVFAAADRMMELLELSHSPSLNYRVWDPEKRRMVTRGHPYFRLFKNLGEVAVIPGRQLAALRSIERKRKPRGLVKPVMVGANIRLSDGGFAGLDGVVESVRGKFAMVAFPGFPLPVQIAAWLLQEELDEQAAIKVNRPSSEQALSAKAA